MKRNVGKNNVHILRSLLEKKFKEAMSKIGETFRHDFSYEKPHYELTLRVDAYDFATSVMETELLSLQRKLNKAEARVMELEAEHSAPTCEHFQGPLTETIHEFGQVVVSHQKKGNYHRLVICCTPPQKVSDWVPRLQPAELGDYIASWDKVEDRIPF